jgi:hypothetical protein
MGRSRYKCGWGCKCPVYQWEPGEPCLSQDETEKLIHWHRDTGCRIGHDGAACPIQGGLFDDAKTA